MDFRLTKEQELLKKSIQEFCAKELEPIADKIERENNVPENLITKLAGLKVFGIPCDREYGGVGGSFTDVVLAIEELGKMSSGICLLMAAHYLPVIAILRNGTEEQKVRFLPGLAQGSSIGSFAFTEAGTGSDPSAITTTAKLDGGDYVLNGSKRFISNATYDGTIVLFAREGGGVSAFIGEKNKEGYSTPTVWDMMGLRGGKVADIHLKDWRVPAASLLGKPGDGYPILLDAIAVGKLNVSAMLLGVSQAALEEAIKYAKEKTARGRPIASLQAIQVLVADMATALEAARSLTYRLASEVDQGADIMKDSAITKLFVSQMAAELTTKAIEVHGSYGYTKEFKVERLHRDAMAGSIIEGVNEIQRVIIAGSLLR